MKAQKQYSKVVRLNQKEELIINLLRSMGYDRFFVELKGISQDELASSPIIKRIIQLLDCHQFKGLDQLVTQGTLSNKHCNQLKKVIEEKKNIMITGGIGVGKTTLLRAILNYQSILMPHTEGILLDPYNELNNKSEANVAFRQTPNLSIKDLDFLQKKINQAFLCINEIACDEDALALQVALQSRIKTFTTIHDATMYDKSTLNHTSRLELKEKFKPILSKTAFVVIKMEKYHVVEIEDVYF